jgi:hypothetical protein
MKKFKLALHLVAVLAFVAFSASLASAQATRTWVSGVGDDANPCSRTAPCRTFAGAISKTATNGEIDVMDPAPLGSVTIVKSITLDGNGTFAGILAHPSNGVVINLNTGTDPLKIVRLRGISISGSNGGTQGGIRGIVISSANPGQPKVILEDIIVDNFTQQGVHFNSNGGELVMKNCMIRNNAQGGIHLSSNGANIVNATIVHSEVVFNQEGLRVDNNVRALVRDSSFSSNVLNGIAVFPQSASSQSEVNVDNSSVSSNKQWGVFAYGVNAGATIRLSNTTVTNNSTNGLHVLSGGQILSWKNNRIAGNNPDGAPTGQLTEQ